MLPVLLAEESQRAAERLLVGTGAGSADVRRKVIRGWERDRRRGGAAPDPARTAATPAALTQLGFGLRLVPAKPKGPTDTHG